MTKAESELVRDELTRLVGAQFEVMQVRNDFPGKKENVEWYVRCPEWRHLAESDYANIAWKAKSGEISIETLTIGDTLELVEGLCGEQAVERASEFDMTGFDSQRVLDWFNQTYPLVGQQFAKYQEILRKISDAYGIPLEIRFDSKDGIVFYSIRARIDASNLDLKGELLKVEPAVRALVDAFEAIEELDLKARAWD